MDNLKFAVETSYEFMKKEIGEILDGTIYSSIERQRLFYACGTCLHWILDFAERIKVSDENNKVISASRFANNSLKHDKDLFEFTEQTGGFTFPITFPLVMESKEVRWMKLENNGKYENQYKNYEDYLEGKPVVETCKDVIEMLLGYIDSVME